MLYTFVLSHVQNQNEPNTGLINIVHLPIVTYILDLELDIYFLRDRLMLTGKTIMSIYINLKSYIYKITIMVHFYRCLINS